MKKLPIDHNGQTDLKSCQTGIEGNCMMDLDETWQILKVLHSRGFQAIGVLSDRKLASLNFEENIFFFFAVSPSKFVR